MSEQNHTPPADSRPILFAPGYRICDGGTVWTRRVLGSHGCLGPWRIVHQSVLPRTGYLQVRIHTDSGSRRLYVHRLVLEVFVGPCPPDCECCHNDGDPTNNFVSNLRWDTRAENLADRLRHGKIPKGQGHRLAKLSESDVREIFRLARQGKTLDQIAAAFGVSFQNVSRILNREMWSHVAIEDDLLVRSKQMRRGEDHVRAKLKAADIPEIFRLNRSGLTRQQIAEIYGVTRTTVGMVIRRVNWRHVPIDTEETGPCSP